MEYDYWSHNDNLRQLSAHQVLFDSQPADSLYFHTCDKDGHWTVLFGEI